MVFSVVNSAIFTAPPYNFTVGQVGLMSMSPFVLCTLGYMIAGPLNDYIVLYLTRKNKGVYGSYIYTYKVLLLGVCLNS